MRTYKVHFNDKVYAIEGSSPGNAARRVFKTLIKTGHIKRQPRTLGGGWEGVFIEPLKTIKVTDAQTV